MSAKRPKQAPSGLSLLELVLSFGILAIAILALIGVFASGVTIAAQARDLSVATELGRQTMERIRSTTKELDFSHIPNGQYTFDGRLEHPTTGTPPFPPTPYPSVKINNHKFDIVVTGEELVLDKIKNIKIEVYWDDVSHITIETRVHP